jgi:hypothetical protein
MDNISDKECYIGQKPKGNMLGSNFFIYRMLKI